MRPHITGMTPSAISQTLNLKKSFQGKQIFQWIAKGAVSFEAMTNISKEFRSQLLEMYGSVYATKIIAKTEDKDNTAKLGIQLPDGHVIESVLLQDDKGRQTACISSQAGCGMKCAFCKTGTMGLHRNLASHEIVEQFLHLKHEFGPISHIVFMGMGEPLANLPELRKAIAVLNHSDGLDIGIRKITISTCGVIPGIKDLADNGPDVRLAVSLITADQKLREKIMPIAKSYSLKDLKESLLYYQVKAKKRITLEYVLLGGVNTSESSAYQLIQFSRGLEVIINLIPWNPSDDLPFEEPKSHEIRKFISILEKEGVNIAQRYKKGRGVNGACGQLATKY